MQAQLASQMCGAAAETTYPAIVKSGEVYVRCRGVNGWFGAVSVKERLRRMIRRQKERRQPWRRLAALGLQLLDV
jgi:hypothetical protein